MLAPDPFEPEALGRRLRLGAPAELRHTLATGLNNSVGTVSDRGPVTNGRGQGLIVTAPFGNYFDTHFHCPAPWHSLIRLGSTKATHVWTAKVAPSAVTGTSHGFVLWRGECVPRGLGLTTRKDSIDWYVNARGRIGQLRVMKGDPPRGTSSAAVQTGDRGLLHRAHRY